MADDSNLDLPRKAHNASTRLVKRFVEVDQIPGEWVVGHILLLTLAAFFGLFGGVLLSMLYNTEKSMCGMPTLTPTSVRPHNEVPVNINGSYIVLDIVTPGNSDDACAFTQYSLISSFIFGTIWVAFFLMCRRGGPSADELPHPWRIVLPALIFTSICGLICFGASVQLSVSLSKFCNAFDAQYAYQRNISLQPSRCTDLDKFLPSQHYISIGPMITLAETMVWLTTISWASSAGLCTLRMLMGPDFQIVLIPQEGEEIVGRQRKISAGYKRLDDDSQVANITTADIHGPPHPPATQIQNTNPTSDIQEQPSTSSAA